MSKELLCTVDRAAEILCVKPCTIYSWVHQRKIPFRKHGRLLVFSVPDLMEWSRKRTVYVDFETQQPVDILQKKCYTKITKASSLTTESAKRSLHRQSVFCDSVNQGESS